MSNSDIGNNVIFKKQLGLNYERYYYIKEYKFNKLVSDTIRDGGFIYSLLVDYTCKRFDIPVGFAPNCVYEIVSYYFNEGVDEDFRKWLNKEDAPFIRKLSEAPKIFPEVASLSNSNYKLIELANKIYNLDLKIDGGDWTPRTYIYSLSFDFID